MQEWQRIWSRELRESPPADEFVRGYFVVNEWWDPPEDGSPDGATGDGAPEVWECPLPDMTE